MRKALILTVLALFGSEALAQKSFRHTPTVALDDLQDNEMALDISRYPAGMNIPKALTETLRVMNNDYRVKVGRWDDSQDNEMFYNSASSRYPIGTVFNPPPRSKPSHLGFDDFEDDTLFTQADLGRMSSPFLSGSGLVGGGGSARGGGVAMGGTGQLNLNIAKNTQLITGLSASHAPGSRVNFQPHVGVNFKFDDQDDELFAEDDELFTQGDMGRMSGFLGNGGSGLVAGGGSARGGGVAWGGAGQYAHNIGKNTQLIGGASLSHAPGSRVGINPHVGVKFSFDDAEEN